MKYFIAALIFLTGLGVTLFTTPASHAGGTVYVDSYNDGFVDPYYGNNYYSGTPYYYPQRQYYHRNLPIYYTPYGQPGYVFDNIYGPGASAARRMAPLRIGPPYSYPSRCYR